MVEYPLFANIFSLDLNNYNSWSNFLDYYKEVWIFAFHLFISSIF
ncbi:hypothetical protein EV201_1242 [Ancylomarina subtilis]|uniref:Uncharacterized protein n=1 Tax=Ancylomarina subtilis TaxID=1639035 RepID=A0A4Q7VK44_9BACT|nr:hypothetical protein EV201_1242 [Ancylomarina subtilis]